MAQYLINIDEEALRQQIRSILNRIIEDELEDQYGRRAHITPLVETMVKDIVYSQKDKIIEMVVNRASKELVRKGMPKLLERMAGTDG